MQGKYQVIWTGEENTSFPVSPALELYIDVLAIPEYLLIINAQKEERRIRQHTEGLDTDNLNNDENILIIIKVICV